MEDGFVFAGGRSSRMGAAKHSLAIKGQTFLERAVQVMENAGLRVRIVVGPGFAGDLEGREMIQDLIPERGPLGALYTALHKADSERIFVLPCDTPLVEPSYYEFLQELPDRYDIVVPEDEDGRIHPLCAAYSQRCESAVETLLEWGGGHVRSLLEDPGLMVLRLRPEEWHFSGSCFFNVNTHEDYESLLEGPCGRFKD